MAKERIYWEKGRACWTGWTPDCLRDYTVYELTNGEWRAAVTEGNETKMVCVKPTVEAARKACEQHEENRLKMIGGFERA